MIALPSLVHSKASPLCDLLHAQKAQDALETLTWCRGPIQQDPTKPYKPIASRRLHSGKSQALCRGDPRWLRHQRDKMVSRCGTKLTLPHLLSLRTKQAHV